MGKNEWGKEAWWLCEQLDLLKCDKVVQLRVSPQTGGSRLLRLHQTPIKSHQNVIKKSQQKIWFLYFNIASETEKGLSFSLIMSPPTGHICFHQHDHI